jgi:3-oxoacyl-[acyl-carrier protein] reductase
MLADVSQEWLRELEATLPLGRFALPEEIAAAVVFLASPDSNLFVGQTLCPNSGSVML